MSDKVGDVIWDAACRPVRIVSITPIESPRIEYQDGRPVEIGTVKYTAIRVERVGGEA